MTSDNSSSSGGDDDDDNHNEKIESAKEENPVCSSTAANYDKFEQPNPTRSVRITGFEEEGNDHHHNSEFDS